MERERQQEQIELKTSSERQVNEESEESKPQHVQEQCSHPAPVNKTAAKSAMLDDNSSTYKTSFAIASLLISLVFGYLAYWSCSVPIEKSKWPSTTGVITSSEITGIKQRTLRIEYEFTIEGEKFTLPETLDSMCALQLPKGKTVVVRYNPVRHSDTVREPEINGATILFGLISAIMMILVLGGLSGSSSEAKRDSEEV